MESSRINVNKDNIKKWAEENYREQYDRVKKTRTTRISPTLDELHVAIKNIRNHLPLENTSLDKNMKDPIFNMGLEIISNCYYKENDGLDHFLSLRIRHGSLMGYLRAPMEKEHLLEQGLLNMDSPISKNWKDKIEFYSAKDFEKFITGLKLFQEKFDNLIEDLRAKYLQIRNVERPDGLFTAKMARVVLDAYHSEWEDAKTFDDFFLSCWDGFKSLLENSLKNIRKFLDEDILKEVNSYADEFSLFINDVGMKNADRAIINSAITRGATAFQEAIRLVKQWFTFVDEIKDNYELEYTQVLELVFKVFRNARPSLNIEVSSNDVPNNYRFNTQSVSILVDAFFIILDNIYKHSGYIGSVKIELITKKYIRMNSSKLL
ncbi:hypothetical protein [Methylovorus sp. MP688]|uniref:hypothetical protein n=1 Tax=Methylovorus sp. (strain MP688) TaxID=887061 RepID=UPI0001EC4C28|nr:hypothetical protein [Methylovorus sp. MP688]ADQ85460.1 conserved hypothetical protein [Methylovorus sp. MP688]